MRTIIEILIDVSSSMGEVIGNNKTKMDLAKEILIQNIIPKLHYSDSIGIRLFGGHCNIINEVENIPNPDFYRLKEFIENQIPEPHGTTPLALAIKTAVDNLRREPSSDKEIYLVTDGEETCGGNIIESSDYAAQNGINCKIHIIGIGSLSNEAIHQFEIITSKTGGKNINIAKKGISKGNIDKDLQDLFHSGIDEIVNLIDNDYSKQKDTFKFYDKRSIKEYLFRKNLSINYIPSDQEAACHNTLLIEYYDDDLTNLVEGLKHVENCRNINKEVLVLMKKWDSSKDTQNLKSWQSQFANRGIIKFCVKLEGFKSYNEIKS